MVAMAIEGGSMLNRIIEWLFGKRPKKVAPSYQQVVRRATRAKAERVTRDAIEVIDEMNRHDPMELELLGKRKDKS